MTATKKPGRKDAAARRDAATDKAVAMTADLLRTLDAAHALAVALAGKLAAPGRGGRPECFGRTPHAYIIEDLTALAYNIEHGLSLLDSAVTTEVHLARWEDADGHC
jgi:hypothetical protein